MTSTHKGFKFNWQNNILYSPPVIIHPFYWAWRFSYVSRIKEVQGTLLIILIWKRIMNNACRRFVRLQWGKLSHPRVKSIVSIKEPKPNMFQRQHSTSIRDTPTYDWWTHYWKRHINSNFENFKFLHEQVGSEPTTYVRYWLMVIVMVSSLCIAIKGDQLSTLWYLLFQSLHKFMEPNVGITIKLWNSKRFTIWHVTYYMI